MKELSMLIFISSFYLLVGGIFDFLVTTSAYLKYGTAFYYLEANQNLIYCFQNGFVPLHMVILPMIIFMLSIFAIFHIERMEKKPDNYTKFLCFIAIVSVSILAFSHFCGGFSWFYYGYF